MTTTSSTKRYCGFKAGFICNAGCALYDGAGCALRRIPSVLGNLEAETRAVRDALDGLDRKLGQVSTNLQTLSTRLDTY